MPVPSVPGSAPRPSATELQALIRERVSTPAMVGMLRTQREVDDHITTISDEEHTLLDDDVALDFYSAQQSRQRRGAPHELQRLDQEISGHLTRHAAAFLSMREAICDSLRSKLFEARDEMLQDAGRQTDTALNAELSMLIVADLRGQLTALTDYATARAAFVAARVEQLYRGKEAPTVTVDLSSIPDEVFGQAVEIFVGTSNRMRSTLLARVEAEERAEHERVVREAAVLRAREEAERKNRAVTESFAKVAEFWVSLNGKQSLSEKNLSGSELGDFEQAFREALQARFGGLSLQEPSVGEVHQDRFSAYNRLAHQSVLMDKPISGASPQQKEALDAQCSLELHRIAHDYLHAFLGDLREQVQQALAPSIPASGSEAALLFQGLEAQMDEFLNDCLVPQGWAERVEHRKATIVAALPAAAAPSGSALPPPLPPFGTLPSDFSPVMAKMDELLEALGRGTAMNTRRIVEQMLDTLKGELTPHVGEAQDDYQYRLQSLMYPFVLGIITQLPPPPSSSVAAPTVAVDVPTADELMAEFMARMTREHGVQWGQAAPVIPEAPEAPVPAAWSRVRRGLEFALKGLGIFLVAVTFDKCDGTDKLDGAIQWLMTSSPSTQETAAPTAPAAASQAPETSALPLDWVKCGHAELIPLPSPDGEFPKCGDTDLVAQTHADKLIFIQCDGAAILDSKIMGDPGHEFAFVDRIGTLPSVEGDTSYVPFRRGPEQICADEGTGVYAIPVVKR